jgi:gas vesicle protein
MAKGKFALGAVFAAAAGFVTGILLAPKSGKETREEIKVNANKAKDATVEKAEELKGKATDVAKDVTRKAKDVASDVEAKADEIKGRVERAVKGAQEGAEKPEAKKQSSKK